MTSRNGKLRRFLQNRIAMEENTRRRARRRGTTSASKKKNQKRTTTRSWPLYSDSFTSFRLPTGLQAKINQEMLPMLQAVDPLGWQRVLIESFREIFVSSSHPTGDTHCIWLALLAHPPLWLVKLHHAKKFQQSTSRPYETVHSDWSKPQKSSSAWHYVMTSS